MDSSLGGDKASANPAKPSSPPPRFAGPPVPSKSVPRPAGSKAALPPRPEPVKTDPEIIIRTMRDDIEEDKGAATSAAADKAAPAASRSAAPGPVPSPAKPAGSFPLPPRGTAQQQKVVMAPTTRSKRRRLPWQAIVGGIIGIACLAAASWGAWYFLLAGTPDDGVEDTPGTAQTVEANRILPASYQLVVHYDFSTADHRAQVLEMWQQDTPLATSGPLGDLLDGNPSLLANQADITSAYYVVLESVPRPFLVVPKTAAATDLLSGSSNVRIAERDGWYIIHALNTQAYETALSQGTVAGQSAPELSVAQSGPLHVTLGPAALSQLRRMTAGATMTVGQLERLALVSQSLAATHASFSGLADLNTPSVANSLADQTLLSLVPSDVTVVRLGADLAGDISRWRAVASQLDRAVLETPAVAQLLTELTGPYAWYVREAAGEPSDVGLIVKLPPAANNEALIGDATLEQALFALVPLITQQPVVGSIAFADGTYEGVGLRFANFNGSTSALDYTIVEDYLLVGTSKEGMFALLDTAASTTASLAASQPWQNLISAWGGVPSGQDVMIGQTTHPALRTLFPADAAGEALLFGLSLQQSADETQADGVVLFSDTAAAGNPAPTSSPVASPVSSPVAASPTPPTISPAVTPTP